MKKNEIRKVIISILLTIIPAISTNILLHIMTVPVTIMIFVLIVVILNFIRYRVDKFYEIPVYIRKFKKLIYSNKDFLDYLDKGKAQIKEKPKYLNLNFAY